jgi:hypothetical protein
MTLRPGFPIRKSADQRLLAPPHGLSQRATSFIASQCQGIHQMPLSRLIQSVLFLRTNRLGTLSISVISCDQLQALLAPIPMASLKGTKTLERTGKLQSSSDFTGLRQGYDSSAHDHGKTPVAGRLHPINNVKQRRSTRSLPPSELSCELQQVRRANLVGQGRFELPTSRLSSARSNQLSY